MLYLTFRINLSVNEKSQFEKEREVLPEFEFKTLQGASFMADNIVKGSLVIIVFFNPECYYCIHEVGDIIENADSFENIDILLVSEQSLNTLAEFYEEYKINRYPKIKLLHSDYQYINSLFGITKLPSTIIYDKSRRLVKCFKGDVSIEVIKNIVIST